MRKELYFLKNPPSVAASAAVVGKKEHEGPLGADFDLWDAEDRFGCETWEQAEAEMVRLAFSAMLEKTGPETKAPELLFAGDLLNQCTATSFGLLPFSVPYLGLYGACSTMAEGILLSALAVGNGICTSAAAAVSSHFCTAERQFRAPVEYGGQRPQTSQWTVTGAGALLLTEQGEGPFVTEVLPGIMTEHGIRDANNMGAAMAPAAMDTLTRYFSLSGMQPSDFDLILTGDLGSEGHAITAELLCACGLDIRQNYEDCGRMIYDPHTQDVHAGGSGCGCSASVLCGTILNRFRNGIYHDILFIGTGALMSPGSLAQGYPIAGIAHLVRISAQKPDRQSIHGKEEQP